MTIKTTTITDPHCPACRLPLVEHVALGWLCPNCHASIVKPATPPDRSPHAPGLRDALVEIIESHSSRALVAALDRGIITARELDAPSVASLFSRWRENAARGERQGIRLRALGMLREHDAAGKGGAS